MKVIDRRGIVLMSFRRFNKYICALSLAAVCTVTTMGATLTDVTSAHWAYSAIVDLEERGVMALTSSGQFFPNQTMSYFEIADVMAKATGYVDVDIATNVDETFKAQIKANYEKQKATLATYAAKYSTWNSAYNQQIAYLLGRGYMSTSDLDKFITKTSSGEIKNIITKEDLAVLVVRLLEKEKTAVSTYKSTGFKDESSIAVANRPHMAYLKSIGIISPDASGNANGKMKVTKALCAKMISSALQIKDTTNGSGNSTGDSDSTTTTKPNTNTVTITKILTKNANEYYMCLKMGDGEAKYYSIKTTTKILDASGNEVAITKVDLGSTAKVTIESQNNTDYITSIQLVDTNSTDQNTGNNTDNTNNDIQATIVSGTLLEKVNSGILRLSLTGGTTKAYVLDDDCTITLNGNTVSADSLSVSDTMTITVQNNAVTKIVALSGTGSLTSNGQVAEKKLSGTGYAFTIKQNNNTSTIIIPDSAEITRNNKTVDVKDIRIGDTLKVTKKNGVVTSVEATGVKSSVTGTIKEIHIAQTSKVLVNVNNETKTYILASDVEMYDNYEKEFITVRELHLGQEVTLLLDSEEVISLDVEDTSTSVKLMGTITNIGRNYSYIDVLVDYDYITGESKVYKRIDLTTDTNIMLNGKKEHRSILEEDMEIVVDYKYLDDTVPEKILVIQ